MQPNWPRKSKASFRSKTSLQSALRFSSFLFLTVSAFGQAVPADDERLLATARLWVTVEYFHPLIATGKIDWDQALVTALPGIREAKTLNQYKAAITGMLKPFAEQHSTPQRTWVHYNLEHSAFLVQNPDVAPQSFEMGGFTVKVQLSEPAASAAAAPSDPSEKDYAGAPYPSTELRILAAFKLWGTIHYFFAYRDLMDADWDDEFPKFLHTFVDAKNAREYHLAVAQAVTKLDDSHSEATSSELEDYFGRASVGIRLRLLEKKPLVTELLDDSAAAAGIQVGDIILRVDDENIVKRIDREAAYLPASSHQALSERVMRRILNGPAGSEALLTIRHHDGGEVDVRLKRTAEPVPERGSAMKQLSAKIGYIDLTRLQPGDVDAVFRQVADKETLVLDARGELLADARLLASHFNNKTGVAGAIVSGPLLLIPDLPKAATIADTHSFFSVESVPVSGGDFSGRVVMLVDGRTIGEAEHLGLLLEAARKIPFVGSESAGACGSVSHFALPGGIRVSFSSADVRHANTGKLQRVGLEPSAVTELTLADVRAGRDVVLEKALEYLSQHP